MIKRYSLLPMTTDTDGSRMPVAPASASSWSMLHNFGNRALVKMAVPDGTAKTANTIADVTLETDEDGTTRQIDINAEPLNATQRTTVKNMLTNAGFDVSRFDGDGIDDRAKLLRFVLRRLAGWQDMTPRELLDKWDVA